MASIREVALLLALLSSLIGLTIGQTLDYSVVYSPYPACDLTVDSAGFIYAGLCGGGVLQFNSSGSPVTAFDLAYSAALASSTAYYAPLSSKQIAVGASGTVWTLDSINAQLVGVSNVGASNAVVSVISIEAERSSLFFSVAPDSDTLWLLFQGDQSFPVQQLSPQGAVLQQWGPSSVTALANYTVWGIFAASGGLVFVSGCYPSSAYAYYFDNHSDAGELFNPSAVVGCDIRRFSANGSLLQIFHPIIPSAEGPFKLTFIESIVVDSAGSVLALDPMYAIVYRWAANGTQVLVEQPTRLSRLAIAPSDAVHALTTSDTFAVVCIDPASLAVLSSFAISSADLYLNFALTLSPDHGILYTTSYSSARVVALNATFGAVLSSLGVDLLASSGRVTTDSAGNVYVCDYVQKTVVKMASNGSLLRTFSDPSQPFGAVEGVAVNPLTNEVIAVDADYLTPRLVIFSQNGSVVQTIVTTGIVYSLFNYYSMPETVAVSSKGAIVYLDAGYYAVVILNATTLASVVITFYDVLGYPEGLAVSLDDRIFVAATTPSNVYTFSMTGELLSTLLYPSEGLDVYALAYNPSLDLLYGMTSTEIISFTAAPPTLNGSLCAVLYGLPGNVDYPWSVAVSLQFQYLPITVFTKNGTAIRLVSGSGSRTFTDRFGIATSSAIILGAAAGVDNLLYLNTSMPVDTGIVYSLVGSSVQLPGNGPRTLYSSLTLLNSGSYITESSATRVDKAGFAFLSTVPGFRNLTIGPSNINSLAISYATCQAPLTFTNGLRSPTEPSASNGALRFLYSYNISDGVTYNVFVNLTLTASSPFATTQDLLGNPLPDHHQHHRHATLHILTHRGSTDVDHHQRYPRGHRLAAVLPLRIAVRRARRVHTEHGAVPRRERHRVYPLSSHPKKRFPRELHRASVGCHVGVDAELADDSGADGD